MTEPFTHGQDVAVYSAKGVYEHRGRIQSVHQTNPWHYDVMPKGEKSLKAIKTSIPHEQLRPVGKPILAYEKQECAPKHIFDEA